MLREGQVCLGPASFAGKGHILAESQTMTKPDEEIYLKGSMKVGSRERPGILCPLRASGLLCGKGLLGQV